MKILLVALSLCVMLAGITPIQAVNPDEVLADPVLELRAREISKELRCLVCQNQSIDDSDADLARDLRVLVRERLLTGESDTEVLDYVVSRYGEFVLLKPVLGLHTLLLWVAAPLLFLVGIIALFLTSRRRVEVNPAPLNEAEKHALAELKKTDED